MANIRLIVKERESASCGDALREILKRELRGKDRRAIALALGISVHVLNGWIAAGRRQSRFPAEQIENFCRAVGSDELKRFILGAQLNELLRLGECVAVTLNGRARLRVMGRVHREQ
jgi:hypothetical protein